MLLEATLKYSQRAGLTEEAEAIGKAFHVMTVVPNQANDMMDIGRLQGFEVRRNKMVKKKIHEEFNYLEIIFSLSLPSRARSRLKASFSIAGPSTASTLSRHQGAAPATGLPRWSRSPSSFSSRSWSSPRLWARRRSSRAPSTCIKRISWWVKNPDWKQTHSLIVRRYLVQVKVSLSSTWRAEKLTLDYGRPVGIKRILLISGLGALCTISSWQTRPPSHI